MQLHVWGERRRWLKLNLCLVNHFPLSCRYKKTGVGESLHGWKLTHGFFWCLTSLKADDDLLSKHTHIHPTSSHYSSVVCWETDDPGVHLELITYLSKHGSTNVTKSLKSCPNPHSSVISGFNVVTEFKTRQLLSKFPKEFVLSSPQTRMLIYPELQLVYITSRIMTYMKTFLCSKWGSINNHSGFLPDLNLFYKWGSWNILNTSHLIFLHCPPF